VTLSEGKEGFPSPFGRYTLTERLAMGGMAEVFKAKITAAHGFEKPLVIKRILPQLAEDRTFVSMFIDEAKLTAQLIHPKIVQVIDFGEVNRQYFIALEFIDGFDALALLRGSATKQLRLPPPICMFIALEVLDALDYAHNARDNEGRPMRLVHRDISPSNLFISRRGDVKLGDFGIAHATERESKTQAGTLKGKYGYMSPEQVLGGALDGRSDVFAVGIVLSEMLMGRRLFSAPNDLDVLLMVRDGRLERLDKYARDLPPALDHIVRKALAKRVEDRYQSAAEFRDALADLLFQTGLRVSPADVGRIAADFLDPSAEATTRAVQQCKRWEMRATGSHPGQRIDEMQARPLTGPHSGLSSSSSAPRSAPRSRPSVSGARERDVPVDVELDDPGAVPHATANLDRLLSQPLSVVDLDKYEAPGSRPRPIPQRTPTPPGPAPTARTELAAMSPMRVFCELAVAQESGLLRLETPPHTRDLYFDRGIPVMLLSNAGGEEVADLRDRIIATFSRDRGRASFFRGVHPTEAAGPSGLDPFEIMGAGVLTLPLDIFRLRFQPLLDRRPAAVAPARIDPASFRLGPTPQELLGVLDGSRSIRDWMGSMPTPDEQMTFLRTLYLLTESGLAALG
jgi:serine/threonine protein kinase